MANRDTSHNELSIDDIHQRLMAEFEGLTYDEVNSLSFSIILLLAQFMNDIDDFFDFVRMVKKKIFEPIREL